MSCNPEELKNKGRAVGCNQVPAETGAKADKLLDPQAPKRAVFFLDFAGRGVSQATVLSFYGDEIADDLTDFALAWKDEDTGYDEDEIPDDELSEEELEAKNRERFGKITLEKFDVVGAKHHTTRLKVAVRFERGEPAQIHRVLEEYIDSFGDAIERTALGYQSRGEGRVSDSFQPVNYGYDLSPYEGEGEEDDSLLALAGDEERCEGAWDADEGDDWDAEDEDWDAEDEDEEEDWDDEEEEDDDEDW